MKKKIKDLTVDEAKAICIKSRTKANGKIKDCCVRDCPLNTRCEWSLFDTNLRACDIIYILNKEIEVEDDVD